MRDTRDGRRPGHLAAAILAVVVSTAPAAADELLTVRANDAEGEPGGRVALVLRTYAPRGIEQGQICVSASSRTKAATASPFAVLEEVVVFSAAGDAQSVTAFDDIGQTALVEFSSPTGSVNASDGPLAVFFFRLQSALVGGEFFELAVDTAATFLVAADGLPVAIEPRAGVLRIRAPGEPLDLAAEGDAVRPGEVAVLGVDTVEPFEVGAGQVVFTYDPAFAAGPPQVYMDPRHGDATFTADTSVAGRVEVTFQSPDGSLNRVPGSLVSIMLPTSAALPAGSASAVALEPGSTWLEDPLDQPIDLALEPDVLELTGLVFADGFESGGVAAWSTVAP